MTNVYFIRHTSVNVEPGTCYGQSDVDVNPTFRHEASICKERISGIHFDKVYTSPLSRCTRLAAFCGFPDAERSPEIMELNFGRWEMRKYDDIKDPVIETWYKDYINTRTPDGESFMDQYKRVSSFLDKLKESGYGNVLVFAHGGVLACALAYSGTITFDKLFSNIPGYGEMIKIVI